MKLDSKTLLKIAQGEVRARLDGDFLLKLAKEKGIESKAELAREIDLSRMHLYRLLAGSNAGVTAIKKIASRFPEHKDELFFLESSNKKDTKQMIGG
ncbi:helix-turn-helix domain-containing protein [Natroniella sulfidigena]|uniref:helix-turn-helix domain-containing protein n=1 Tax=Natroniella sulfidigena TaxID=723921 RepID=UPI00200A43A4|nr:helix-turn-helix domain-containing protein [Natroniella sulfidigena]MCK8817175.1 helix-turn-helix domain-containing protein [Natroniella sulfidigena]